MDTDAAAVVADQRDAPVASDAMAVFAVLWAAATLFHVWGPSGRATNVFSDPSTVGVLHVVAGVVAVVVLLQPRSLLRLAALAAIGPVTLWFEAPILGSHWVVAAFVDIAFLLSLVAARSAARLESVFFVMGRWVLIGFYSFAAFSKLNHAFFTPRVSCGTFYFDELTGSLGLSIHSATGGWWAHLIPLGVAGIELTIPVLLLVRRTRNLGVVVGLVFHGLIALDQTHLFSDFSSVLVALFVLFLPSAFFADALAQYRSLRPQVRERLHATLVAGCALLLAIQWYGRGAALERLFADGRAWAWLVLDVVTLVLVVRFLLRRRPAPIDHPLSFGRARAPRWLAIVPVLVLLNGLSPFLELRTAYAFNMYSNLETADGTSNHFLITRTLPLTDFQSDLVRVIATNDPGLQLYVDGRFDIPFLQLRDYLSHHAGASLTYQRNGAEHRVDHASDDPALVEAVPSWESKLFAFRSLDQTEPNRCQPTFFPAL